jgi:hypothetical protein
MNGRLAWTLKPRRPVLGQLGQGVVFSCARAEDYPACPVYGLTITARCDIAQDKAKIYSYLPIVSLRDWWHHDGAGLLIDRARRQLMGALRSCLRDSAFAENILEVESPRGVVETLFPSDVVPPVLRIRTRALTAVESLERLDVLVLPLSTDQLRQLCAEFKGLRRSILDELTSARLMGFLFLPQIEFDGADDGFVVSLREVRHLPRILARLVGAGLAKPLEEARLAELSPHLSFIANDFAMPLGLLPSPLIEHIMQTFSLLFSRIGLEDLPDDYLEALWERLGIDPQVQL